MVGPPPIRDAGDTLYATEPDIPISYQGIIPQKGIRVKQGSTYGLCDNVSGTRHCHSETLPDKRTVPQIMQRLLDLLAGIHDEWAITGNGLTQRLA